MLTYENYIITVERFNYLTGSPKTDENIKATFQGIKDVEMFFADDRALYRLFAKWASNEAEWPTHIDLKNLSLPKFESVSESDVFKKHEFIEGGDNRLFFIEQWCKDHHELGYLPDMNNLRADMLQKDLDIWIKNASDSQKWAIVAYKNEFNKNPEEYTKLISGIIYKEKQDEILKLEEERKEDLLNKSNVDLKNIGHKEVKKISDDRSHMYNSKGNKLWKYRTQKEKDQWSLDEIASRKGLAPGKMDPNFDYDLEEGRKKWN